MHEIRETLNSRKKEQQEDEEASVEKGKKSRKMSDVVKEPNELQEINKTIPKRPDKPCYYPSQIEMGTILKQRIDAIMKLYYKIENLNDRFIDVEFVIYTAKYTMLRRQTEERLLHPDAGVLSDKDKINSWTFMYTLSEETKNKHRELKEKIENNKSTLFVIIADECHWGITKGTEEKPSAHNLLINTFCEEPSPKNVIIIQVSATPYNLLTKNSRIPERPNVTEFKKERRQEGSPSELHIVHWTEVEMKNFEKGVKMKLKCGRYNGGARYLAVKKGTETLRVCSNPQEACTFVVKGEHGKVTLRALQDTNMPNGKESFVGLKNGSIKLVSYKEAKKDSKGLQFQVKLEFGFGVAAFESLAIKGAYICVDKENQVQLYSAKEKRERGVMILNNRIDPNDTSSFEFFLEDCSPVEVSRPVPQYLSLNYYLSTLNKESMEEQKIREDKSFQSLVDAGRRQDRKKGTSDFPEGSLLCAEYVYHILCTPSAANHDRKIDRFCEKLEKETKMIALTTFDFVKKRFEYDENLSESETGKMIRNLIGKAKKGKGHMTIVRAKDVDQANEFYRTLRLARKVAELDHDFEVIRDYGGIQIKNQLMNSKNPFFQKLQPNVCPEPECGCKEFTVVRRKSTCGTCPHVHKQITQYEDLEDLACILILVDKGRMGDTFPRSFNCLDIRLSYDKSTEFGKMSEIYMSSLIQQLGRMCRYTTLTSDDQSNVPYALVGRHLIKKLKESLKRSPAISAIDISPDRYMVKANVRHTERQTGRIRHTKRWLHFVAKKDSYDFENTSKHENRIVLQAEPQIGKTGSYLYLIKLLRDDILGNKDNFVFTIETSSSERELQCETNPTERNSPDLPYWKDMREAKSLLEKPIRRGKYTVGGKFYTHETESFPREYKEKPQREKNPDTKEMTPSEVSSEVDGSNEMRAWPYSHIYSCSSCLQLLQSADPTEAEWIWLIPDENGNETRIRYSIPSVVPYDLLQKSLPKQLPATNCDWGKLDLDKQMSCIPVIAYWIFHPSHRDPKKCTLNYKHVMVDVDSGTKIQYIQAVVVRKEKFDSFKQNWGKTHLIIQLPDKLPGYNSSPATGGIGFARLFIQKLAHLLRLEYVFVFDDNVAMMSEPVFEDEEDGIPQIKRNEHGTMLMKRCPFSSPMHQMQSLVQGKGQPPVNHTRYSLEDDDDAKLKEMFKSFPQYSYTGPASVNEKLSRTEGYAVLGMTKSIPKALKPFDKSQVYSAVLLNVKATAESNVWYRPWPCWEDLRFNDDCDKAGLWVVKFNRYHLWKSQYRDWIINLESPSLFRWYETTTLKDLPEERCINETTEMDRILSYLNSQTANTDDEIQKAVLGDETSSNEKNSVFLKTVYEKLKVPECNLKGCRCSQFVGVGSLKETQFEKEPTASTLVILHHVTDASFYTYQKWFFTASNKNHTRLIFLRSAKDTKPETSITQIKSEHCFQHQEIVERNPSVRVFSVGDPGACSPRCLVVDVTFINDSCYNKEPTNEVSLSDELFIDSSVQTDVERHSSSPSVTKNKIIAEQHEKQQDQLTKSQAVTSWTQESDVGPRYNDQRGNKETLIECCQQNMGEKPKRTINRSKFIQDKMEHEPNIGFLLETKTENVQGPEENLEKTQHQQEQIKRKRNFEETFSGAEQTSSNTKKTKKEVEPLEESKVPLSYDNTFIPVTNSPSLLSEKELLRCSLEGTNATTKKIVELWWRCRLHPNSELSEQEIRNELQSYQGNFETRDEKGYNALLKACSLPRVSQNLVNYLINGEKVDINCRVENIKDPNNGTPAITLAVNYENEKLISLFKKRKSELPDLLLNADREGNTVLHRAVLKVKETAFDELFPLYKTIEWTKVRNNEGNNALDIALELYHSQKIYSRKVKNEILNMVTKMVIGQLCNLH